MIADLLLTWGWQGLALLVFLALSVGSFLNVVIYRMPVMLEAKDYQVWLTGDVEAAAALLKPIHDEKLRSFEVSPRVGNVRNDDPDLLEPYEEREPTLF